MQDQYTLITDPDEKLAAVERAVIAMEQAVADLRERAERLCEQRERPKWATDAHWQAAMQEARDSGYTGHDRYARAAADTLSTTYGYR